MFNLKLILEIQVRTTWRLMKLVHLSRFRGPCYNIVTVFLLCLFGIVFVVNLQHYTIQTEEKNGSTIKLGTSKTTRCANFISLQVIRTWILTINFKFKI
jgi:hypothetical protein